MRLLTFNIRNRYEVDNYTGIYRKKDNNASKQDPLKDLAKKIDNLK